MHELIIHAMKNLKLSTHSQENIHLRELFIQQRKKLGLSQRGLAERLGVIYSFVGKVETGDRRLDIFEFMTYCYVLELNPAVVMQQLETFLNDQPR